MIDTHCHIDGEEFREDLDAVVARAREAGIKAIGVPGINLSSLETIPDICRRYPGYCYPMFGLHPEDVKADWREVLAKIRQHLIVNSQQPIANSPQLIAIGEVGLDF